MNFVAYFMIAIGVGHGFLDLLDDGGHVNIKYLHAFFLLALPSAFLFWALPTAGLLLLLPLLLCHFGAPLARAIGGDRVDVWECGILGAAIAIGVFLSDPGACEQILATLAGASWAHWVFGYVIFFLIVLLVNEVLGKAVRNGPGAVLVLLPFTIFSSYAICTVFNFWVTFLVMHAFLSLRGFSVKSFTHRAVIAAVALLSLPVLWASPEVFSATMLLSSHPLVAVSFGIVVAHSGLDLFPVGINAYSLRRRLESFGKRFADSGFSRFRKGFSLGSVVITPPRGGFRGDRV